jgi:dTDP-4-amino-4,6-dideoxygalactose transaminase
MTVATPCLPAIAGGEKSKSKPYAREARYGDDELRELKEALEQGSLFYTQGKKVSQLESDFAAMCGVRHAIACSSGTSGIHSVLIAIGISPGDEVITAPITDMGSVIPILFQGGVPIFADLIPHSYVLDPAGVEAAITPRTRAVLAVHLGGNACDLDALKALCDRHGIALIEDCAQAFGSRYNDHPIGTIGLAGCFSLNEFKHIGCGDGGIMVTNDNALAIRLRLATDKAYDRRPGVAMRNPAFLANNYRMTELQGAVAVAQLRKLPSIVARRREWCGELSRRLAGVKGITLPEPTSGCDPSWWFYLLRVDPEVLGTDADGFCRAMQAEGIPLGAHYIGQPVYTYPVFTQHAAFERGGHPYDAIDYRQGMCPVAEQILETCVMLGVHEGYDAVDLDETAAGIRKVAEWFCDEKSK